MDIVTMSNVRTERYAGLLSRLDDALVYHSPGYLRLLQSILNCEACHLVATEAEEIVGIVPLMARDSRFGRILNSLPYFGSIGGVLAIDSSVRARLLECYNRLAQDGDVAASTLVSNPFNPVDHSEVAYDQTDERVSFVTPLAGGIEAVRDRFHRSRKFNVRRARRAGVKVSEDPDALGFLADAHRQGMLAIGGRAKDDAFFDSLATYLPDDAYRIYVASIGVRRVAALLLLYFNKTVEYFVPATLPDERVNQPMAAIIDVALSDATAAGYERWNWGGTWPSQTDLATFKQRWGGTPFPYRYFVKINAPHILDSSPADLLAEIGHFYVRPFHGEPVPLSPADSDG